MNLQSFFAILMAMFLVNANFAPLRAQETQTPLATSKQENSKTVWDLVVPQRPDDRPTRLTYQRMAYGLHLIQQLETTNPDKLKQFLSEFADQVKPGHKAWEMAEDLVLLYTNGKAQSDPIDESDLQPSEVEIITMPEGIRRYYGLDHEKDFNRMDWRRDPFGECRIAKRSDAKKVLDNIEKHIDRIYNGNIQSAEAIKKALRTCIASEGNSETCYNAKLKDLRYLMRNHGAGSVGENESYDKGTNVPEAEAIVFWVPGMGWKAIGMECCGNLLEFFTIYKWSSEIISRGLKTPSQLSCTIEPQNVFLKARSDVVEFRLAVTPEQNKDDMSIDWFVGPKRSGSNSLSIEVSGHQIDADASTSVVARVAVGRREVTCRSSVTLRFPQVPPSEPILKPECKSLTSSRNALGPKDTVVLTADLVDLPPGSRNEWEVAVDGMGTVKKGNGSDRLNLRGDEFAKYTGSVNKGVYVSLRVIDAQGKVVAECKNSVIIPALPPPVSPAGDGGKGWNKKWLLTLLPLGLVPLLFLGGKGSAGTSVPEPYKPPIAAPGPR